MRLARVSCLALLLVSGAAAGSAQDAGEARALVGQLGQFQPEIDGRIGNSGQRTPVEQRREATYVKLRGLGARAIPALRQGLTDPDVRVRRNVALYLSFEGGNYAKHADVPLDVTPFLQQLVAALRDEDEWVSARSAQALGHAGAHAAVAVPDLVRLLQDRREGLRNSACIGLHGIGPAARDALPALRRALLDPSNNVRRFAQRAIDRIEPVKPGG